MNDSIMKQDTKNNSQAEKTTRLHYVVLVLLIILASIERIYGIDRQSLWGDELFAVLISYKYNFHNVWTMLINDSHPPGYVLMMYYMLPWIGYTDVAIRLHAFIYGILWIPLIFWLGKRWFSVNVGLLAAALITSSYSAIYFSQEARAYSMLVAFNIANLICLLEILFTEKPHRGYIRGFIISSSIILYLHYTCFIFLCAEILLYLMMHILRSRRGSLREMFIIFGIPLLLYAPWIRFMVDHLTDQSRNWAVSAVPTSKDVFYVFQNLWGPDYTYTQLYIAALIAAGTACAFQQYRQGLTRSIGIIYALLFLLIIPVLAFYIESIVWTPIFEKRYFLITLPMAALLVASVVGCMIQFAIHPRWHTISFLLAIVISSVWLISTNIDRKLYTVLDKDPFREAVNVIKADLGNNISSDDYTVLMTHNEFEHYLRRAHINYDNRWEFHRYYVPQHISKVTEYFDARPKLNYFYYLSVKLPNSESSVYALRQRYKLLSSAEITSTSGAIDIYKFNKKEAPNTSDLIDAGTNRSNEVAKAIAQEIGHKNPDTYTTMMTHDWMQPYLQLNNIQVDKGWPARFFQNPLQFADISDYLYAHPAIDTIYYFGLREPNTIKAVNMLEMQYQLVSTQTFDITAGKMDVFKFNTKIKPALSPELKQVAQSNPINKAAAWVGNNVKTAKPGSYAVIMTHGWFELYLQLNSVAFDKAWSSRRYTQDFQVEDVFAYVNQHKAVENLYYLVLRENKPDAGLLPLLLKYQLISQNTIDSDLGKIDEYRFNTETKKPSDTTAFNAAFSTSPVNIAATWVAKQVGAAKADSYVVLTSRQWYNLYLRKLGLTVDRAWPGHLYSTYTQTEEVFNYVTEHPTITDLYYMALRDADTGYASVLLQTQYKLVSENTIETTVGKVDTFHFDTKKTPSSIDTVKAKLSGSPPNDFAKWIASDTKSSTDKKYTILITHSWFKSFLQFYGLNLDKTAKSCFYNEASQLDNVKSYLNTHPEVDTIYYLVLLEQHTPAAVDALKKQAQLSCQNIVSTPMGQLAMMKFNTKGTPSGSGNAFPACFK